MRGCIVPMMFDFTKNYKSFSLKYAPYTTHLPHFFVSFSSPFPDLILDPINKNKPKHSVVLTSYSSTEVVESILEVL